MSQIKVDTYKLKIYASQLNIVNKRLSILDKRMDDLYWKVGLQGIWNLMQADILTGYSWRLSKCSKYLNETAKIFNSLEEKIQTEDITKYKSHSKKLKDILFDVGVAAKKSADKVRKATEKFAYDVFKSYYSQGAAYQIVQYGKAILKAAKGVVKIVSGVGSLIGTGGLSAPVAVLTIISGANDFYNSLTDAAYTSVGDYDKIGTNALKDLLAKNGGIIGEQFGNKKIGETAGKVIYFGVDFVTSLASLDVAMDKIKQLSSTNLGKFGKEIKEIMNVDVTKIFTTDFETIKYEMKLAGYTFSEAKNFVTNLKGLKEVAKGAIKLGKSVNNILTVNLPGFKNPVVGTFDAITGFFDKIGTGAKVSTKITSYIFG